MPGEFKVWQFREFQRPSSSYASIYLFLLTTFRARWDCTPRGPTLLIVASALLLLKKNENVK